MKGAWHFLFTVYCSYLSRFCRTNKVWTSVNYRLLWRNLTYRQVILWYYHWWCIANRKLDFTVLNERRLIIIFLTQFTDNHLLVCVFQIWQLMWIRVALPSVDVCTTNPQTRPNDPGCEFACRQPEATPTIAIYYYYSARKLILILPSHGG